MLIVRSPEQMRFSRGPQFPARSPHRLLTSPGTVNFWCFATDYGLRTMWLFHTSEHGLEIAALWDVDQERMIGAGAGDLQDLEGPSRLPGGPPQRLQEVGL